ncbi:lysophospholipid acyltransferase family protein [Kaistia nematophila]|uniref:Lysophospholipid acyltransferase family protein n=1 Tax=Kaistia nematophila TaxID=2994654 RepID=A0A9X3DYA9_9HYPH|nr:lysophospholipid acyltransferase family protein [Kaistia nematophila]MCX5567676.1 lysophospholipid acyltransferase family protein [Kaistia nematophila]
MGRLRLAAILAGLLLTTLVLLPVQLFAIRFRPKLAARVPMWWQRVAARCLGLRVRVEGTPATDRPLLIVSNHVSWVDIVTLGSLLPVSFVAKSEVGGWPVVKWLARLQRSVFIDRTRRTATAAASNAIAARLAGGEALVLFAEGTTGDGISILPFRSALVGAAREAGGGDRPIVVQPVAIVYVGFQGLPIDRSRMAEIAWHGDMDLAPHLVGLIDIGAVDAVVAFGEPIVFGPDVDRKQVTASAEAEVRALVRSIRARGLKNITVTAPSPEAPILSEAESG